MKFPKLKFPDSWSHYWSKYPEGFTILESLISWVSQVDKMTEQLNKNQDEISERVTKNDLKANRKLDEKGDFTGSWFGLTMPTLSEEGMRGTVEKIKDVDLPEIKTELEQKARQADLEIERKRIDVFTTLPEGSTTGDAELIDARVGADGVIYNNTGNAIREQYSKLNKNLESQMYGEEMTLNYSGLTVLSNGYVKGSGGISTGQIDLTTNSHKIVTIPIKHLKSIRLVSGETDVVDTMVYGDIYDSVANKVKYTFNVANKEQLLIIPDDWKENSQLRLNWFNYETSPFISSCIANKLSVTDIAKTVVLETEKYVNYNHCVDKPYIFNNKNALFFGDSIVKGFTSGTTTTANGFPKLFSDKVGMAFTNYGVGGSCLSYDYNNLGSVLDKIKSVGTLTSDFLFIAGGVNDWQLAVDLETFKAGVLAICEYLKTNYTGQVIFITPINQGGRIPTETPVADLQEYRNIITEIVMKYNYSVVQGNLFNMPSEKSTPEYIASMFGDKLHPTELGYKVYAKELATILC